jgi:sugar lactone lactonase YvrE
LCGASRFAFAQTVHFSGLQTTVGSGFEEPFAVAVDKSGNLYVGESDGYYVAEIMAVNGAIPASPTIRMLVGGWPTIELPSGLAVDGNGNVFVTDFYKGVVDEILAVDGSIPVSPTIRTLGSSLSNPWGVAVDGSGNVYISEYYKSDIKEIVAVNGSIPASPAIVTVGSGFTNPEGLAIDGSGNLYVADSSNEGNHAVKEIIAVNGSIPVDPTIIKVSGSIAGPKGVAVDGNDNVYVGSVENSIPRISLSGTNFDSVNVKTSSRVVPLPFTFDANSTLGSTAVLTQSATGLDFADTDTGTCTVNTAYAAG